MSSKDIIQDLATKFKLTEGKTADYYFLHGTAALTKTGAYRIARSLNLYHEPPTVLDLKDRCCVHGWWVCPKDKGDDVRVWTTGEAKYNGRAVEGSHSVAMAEKRWKVRGVIELVAPASGIYGEDEFDEDFKQHGRSAPAQQGQAPAQQQPAQNVPEWADDLPQDWHSALSKVAHYSGHDKAKIGQVLFLHCTKFQGDRGWVTPHSKNTPNIEALAQQKPKWAGRALGTLKELLEDLGNNVSVELLAPMWDSDQKAVVDKTLMLVPTGSQPTDAFRNEIEQEFDGQEETAPAPDLDDLPF